MDPTLAKYIARLAQEQRGRGWRVPTALKQLGAQWARPRLAKGARMNAVAARLGVGSVTLRRWLASTTSDVELPRPARADRATAGARPTTAMGPARCGPAAPLPMRTVRVADTLGDLGLPPAPLMNARGGGAKISNGTKAHGNRVGNRESSQQLRRVTARGQLLRVL